jgi:hypothetical protein
VGRPRGDSLSRRPGDARSRSAASSTMTVP